MFRCDNCQFFHPYPPADRPDQIILDADGVRGGGECRAVPPIARDLDPLARFPLVTNEMWCGWFTAKPPVTSPTFAASATTATKATSDPTAATRRDTRRHVGPRGVCQSGRGE